MRNVLRVLVCAAIVAGAIGTVWAQFAKPEDAIKYRQSAMFLIGQHFGGRMGPVVKGQQPYDAEEFARNASLIETLSKLSWEAFLAPGSAEGQTRLKPGALKAPDKFKAAAAQSETEIVKLVGLAKSGDMKAIKGQFGAVGKSCKGCHQEFRTKK